MANNTFEERLEFGAALEDAFTETFNEVCATHEILKFGVESTKLSEAHRRFFRRCQDKASILLRYLPDAVLMPKGINAEGVTEDERYLHLIEFKHSGGGKAEKFHINFYERQLEYYKQLHQSLEVRVIIIGYASYLDKNKPPVPPLRAQYADEIKNYDGDFIEQSDPLSDFFSSKLEIYNANLIKDVNWELFEARFVPQMIRKEILRELRKLDDGVLLEKATEILDKIKGSS